MILIGIGKLIGLSLSRKLFAVIFNKIGPIIRSRNIIDKNLEKFSNIQREIYEIQEKAKNY